jgi:predicted transposase YdaD
METSFNKGKAEANRENARKMKELGISVEIISQVTGLTINEVDML